MAYRVTKQYPDPGTDWRGIAMLTQQMSELFKPSKSRLLSQQQEHEMQMLQAKQAWKFGSEQLELNKTKHQSALEKLEEAKGKLDALSPDIMRASLLEGAIPENSSKMLDDTQGRSVRDLNDLAIQYHNETLRIQKNLDSMKELNNHAIVGQSFGKVYKGDSGAKNYLKEFNVEPNTPGVLSSNERENIKYARLMDIYHVPDEELETTEYLTVNAAGKDINVKPEAQAWIAGFEKAGITPSGAETRLRAETITKGKERKPKEYLNTMYEARKTIQDYEQQGLTMEEIKFEKGGVPKGFTSADIDNFIASGSLYKEAYKAYIKGGGVIPDDLKGVAPVTDDMFYADPGGSFLGADWMKSDNPFQFTTEGLDPEMYQEIQRSDNNIYKQMALNIVYNWDDVIKASNASNATTADKLAKTNMFAALEKLKVAYEF